MLLQLAVLQERQAVLRHRLPGCFLGKRDRRQRFAKQALECKLPAGRLLKIAMLREVVLPHRLAILSILFHHQYLMPSLR